MATAHMQQTFTAPVERLYAHLAEHENLSALFGIRVERLRDGDTEPNGEGSVRKLSVYGLLPFEETVTLAIPNERIEYRITKGSPLRNHEGRMVFSSTGSGGSHLDYTIEFDAAVPGLAPAVAAGLERKVGAALAKLSKTL